MHVVLVQALGLIPTIHNHNVADNSLPVPIYTCTNFLLALFLILTISRDCLSSTRVQAMLFSLGNRAQNNGLLLFSLELLSLLILIVHESEMFSPTCGWIKGIQNNNDITSSGSIVQWLDTGAVGSNYRSRVGSTSPISCREHRPINLFIGLWSRTLRSGMHCLTVASVASSVGLDPTSADIYSVPAIILLLARQWTVQYIVMITVADSTIMINIHHDIIINIGLSVDFRQTVLQHGHSTQHVAYRPRPMRAYAVLVDFLTWLIFSARLYLT